MVTVEVPLETQLVQQWTHSKVANHLLDASKQMLLS